MKVSLEHVDVWFVFNFKIPIVSVDLVKIKRPLKNSKKYEKKTDCGNEIFFMAPLGDVYHLDVLYRIYKRKEQFVRNEITNQLLVEYLVIIIAVNLVCKIQFGNNST